MNLKLLYFLFSNAIGGHWTPAADWNFLQLDWSAGIPRAQSYFGADFEAAAAAVALV